MAEPALTDPAVLGSGVTEDSLSSSLVVGALRESGPAESPLPPPVVDVVEVEPAAEGDTAVEDEPGPEPVQVDEPVRVDQPEEIAELAQVTELAQPVVESVTEQTVELVEPAGMPTEHADSADDSEQSDPPAGAGEDSPSQS